MRHSTTGTYLVIALAAVALGVVVISHRAAVEAVYPIERATLFVKRSVWPRVAGLFDAPGKAAENVRLRREVASLAMLIGEVERLERENAVLRRSLDYASRAPRQWLAAPVLSGHGGASGRDKVLRVGRGSAEGVVENAIVASPDGLVGIVTFVTAHTSEVTLIVDRSVKVVCSVALGNGRVATGILEGGEEGELALTHIRGLSSAPSSAPVTTSRRGGVFPEGFTVGCLVKAAPTESGDWSGVVRPAVDFDSLEDVFIRCER